jgi:hypothetical protein
MGHSVSKLLGRINSELASPTLAAKQVCGEGGAPGFGCGSLFQKSKDIAEAGEDGLFAYFPGRKKRDE